MDMRMRSIRMNQVTVPKTPCYFGTVLLKVIHPDDAGNCLNPR